MIVIKFLSVCLITVISTVIGVLYSKKYTNRVKDLEEIQKALNIFSTQIGFTYEPIPQVFKQIGKNINNNIGTVFCNASDYMQTLNADMAWEKAWTEEKNTNFLKSDLDIILGLSKMLGCTDLEGQVNNIKLTCNLLDNQLEEARMLKAKNEKLYKTLGISIGLAIAILLI